MDGCAALGIDAAEMDKQWGICKKAQQLIKFGGGFYCGLIQIEGKESYYIFNGFFMSMRSKFTAPGTSIYYYVCEKCDGLVGKYYTRIRALIFVDRFAFSFFLSSSMMCSVWVWCLDVFVPSLSTCLCFPLPLVASVSRPMICPWVWCFGMFVPFIFFLCSFFLSNRFFLFSCFFWKRWWNGILKC